jgi:hypothetical protein
MWDVIIRARRATAMLPVLEAILSEFGRRAAPSATPSATPSVGRGLSAPADPDAPHPVVHAAGNHTVSLDVQPMRLYRHP